MLASGSTGNCVYVASPSTALLIDAGLSCKRTEERLQAIGTSLSSVSAVCLTHEHDDHRSSLGVLHRRYGVALYANGGTVDAIQNHGRDAELPWTVFTTGAGFDVGDLHLEPFSVPHDSYDPVGFVVSHGDSRAGIVTDIGSSTGLVRQRLRGCHVLVLESNHDVDMLQQSPRPWSLKQRIAGRQGHLSNAQAGELLCEIAELGLRTVFLAHLSDDCNSPALACNTVKERLYSAGHEHVAVKLTYRDRVSDVEEW